MDYQYFFSNETYQRLKEAYIEQHPSFYDLFEISHAALVAYAVKHSNNLEKSEFITANLLKQLLETNESVNRQWIKDKLDNELLNFKPNIDVFLTGEHVTDAKDLQHPSISYFYNSKPFLQ